MTPQLDQVLTQIEREILRLAVPAAQAQLPGDRQHERGWAERYDILARNLAEPGLLAVARLRDALQAAPLTPLTPLTPVAQGPQVARLALSALPTGVQRCAQATPQVGRRRSPVVSIAPKAA